VDAPLAAGRRLAKLRACNISALPDLPFSALPFPQWPRERPRDGSNAPTSWRPLTPLEIGRGMAAFRAY